MQAQRPRRGDRSTPHISIKSRRHSQHRLNRNPEERRVDGRYITPLQVDDFDERYNHTLKLEQFQSWIQGFAGACVGEMIENMPRERR